MILSIVVLALLLVLGIAVWNGAKVAAENREHQQRVGESLASLRHTFLTYTESLSLEPTEAKFRNMTHTAIATTRAGLDESHNWSVPSGQQWNQERLELLHEAFLRYYDEMQALAFNASSEAWDAVNRTVTDVANGSDALVQSCRAMDACRRAAEMPPLPQPDGYCECKSHVDPWTDDVSVSGSYKNTGDVVLSKVVIDVVILDKTPPEDTLSKTQEVNVHRYSFSIGPIAPGTDDSFHRVFDPRIYDPSHVDVEFDIVGHAQDDWIWLQR